jgi:NADPH:quinone reductase-like Zn-dependent oxidoreductase
VKDAESRFRIIAAPHDGLGRRNLILSSMKAVRIHRFGGPEAIVIEDVPEPVANSDEVVVKVGAAGVGPWDALIRRGNSALPQTLPLTLGYDFAGVIDSVGAGVEGFKVGDEVFGVTAERFTGACAEYARAKPSMIAPKPRTLNYSHAASVPVVSVTASQMVFDLAQLSAGQTVLIHGGAGNVGGYAVQFAKQAGAMVITTGAAGDVSYIRSLGGLGVIDYRASRFEENVKEVDAVIDTVGGEILERSFSIIKRGGIIVSSSAEPSQEKARQHGVRASFVLVEVTAERLQQIAELIDSGTLKTEVGEVLWLDDARRAHEMLEGAPHRRGKIILKTQSAQSSRPVA